MIENAVDIIFERSLSVVGARVFLTETLANIVSHNSYCCVIDRLYNRVVISESTYIRTYYKYIYTSFYLCTYTRY